MSAIVSKSDILNNKEKMFEIALKHKPSILRIELNNSLWGLNSRNKNSAPTLYKKIELTPRVSKISVPPPFYQVLELPFVLVVLN